MGMFGGAGSQSPSAAKSVVLQLTPRSSYPHRAEDEAEISFAT